MKRTQWLARLTVLSLCACSAFSLQGHFAAGRQALIRGDPSAALSHFQPVAAQDPTFVATSATLRQSIWSYVGRAQYSVGQFAEARESLEKALTHLNDDQMARLYLGLTLLRQPVAPPSTNPFSLEDISYALREGVASKRIITLVGERGISFDLDKEIENQLKRSGADAVLLGALKKTAAQNAKRRKAAGDRAQGVKELGSALTGLRSDLDYTIYNTLQGRFWDPGGEIRAQIESCLLLLSSREPDWAKIISTGEWLGQKFEQEIDSARRDESQEERRKQRP
jgi:tetratricopeptide (TPR) repeat protein